MTAAHCLNKGRNFVVVGTHYLTGFADGELANVTQEIKHPNGSDVGIVILDRNITTIQPVPVSFEFVPGGVDTWVRGWGAVARVGPQSPVLKELSVTTWDNTRTSAALFFLRLSDTTLDAGGRRWSTGGPLTIEENGTARLVGVVSYSIGYGLRGFPGIYERASAARAFIEPYLPK
ncbi:hypothetical protein DYB36_013873 [Aphanomyces astaci]|uniref:Peptidase S1 domain-containing protein n=1 Tax=Aphanomyces astaci TaxID=112090 RepID=A0A396ZZX6_APHAT|nr:hypothetical protein DYB36_013873 [Aphanomyces astaci]